MFTDSQPIIDQGSSAPPKPHRLTRQFRVTHTATGFETYVNGVVYQRRDGGWYGDYVSVSAIAGLRHPANCTVNVVPRGREIPLPFDDCPLVIRRQPEPAA